MGYKGTIITDHWDFTFSDEFIYKYKDIYNFGGAKNNSRPISSKFEIKRFSNDLEKDIVKELKSKNENHRIHAVWLREDGLIDRVVFTKDGIFNYEDWFLNNNQHDYNSRQPC